MTSEPAITQKYLLHEEGNAEVQRLQTQHEFLKYHYGGDLLMPGIAEDLQDRRELSILDSGTADGTWMRDLASRFPQASFVGTDLTTSFFPSDPTPNMTFVPQDILQPWPTTFQHRFDLVHQRLVFLTLRDAVDLHRVLGGLADTVKPGGWIQLHEPDSSAPRGANGPAMNTFQDLVRAIKPPAPEDSSDQMVQILRERNFEVHERVINVKIGAAMEDRELAMQHVRQSVLPVRGLANSMKGKGVFSDDELDGLPDRFLQEMETKGAVLPARVIWGRRRELGGGGS